MPDMEFFLCRAIFCCTQKADAVLKRAAGTQLLRLPVSLFSYSFLIPTLSCLIFHINAARVKFRIAHIKVVAVTFVLHHAQTFTETLKMHDFPCTQETDRIADLRILDETKDIIISRSRLLLWCDLVRTT